MAAPQRSRAGSLVNIAFHLKAGVHGSYSAALQLVESKTVLADAQAAMVLSPGLDWTTVLADGWRKSWI